VYRTRNERADKTRFQQYFDYLQLHKYMYLPAFHVLATLLTPLHAMIDTADLYYMYVNVQLYTIQNVIQPDCSKSNFHISITVPRCNLSSSAAQGIVQSSFLVKMISTEQSIQGIGWL